MIQYFLQMVLGAGETEVLPLSIKAISLDLFGSYPLPST